MNLFEMFKSAFKKAVETPVRTYSPWQKKVKGLPKPKGGGFQVRVVRVETKPYEPDRTRGKRFRTRPRSLRGRWEIMITGDHWRKKGKKHETVQVKGKRFVG